ncbi:MAG: LptF/LptG family permease [Saprospiraceae bacterium]|nr:LptF/LptG family permease [Saprospiraceae bacterium]
MLRIKRLDAMLIKGFIPPFIVSFFMALFVLVMQVFWLYVDDILGKGAGMIVILEFLFYLCFSLVPLALPIGVLLAGVFLFGNLGERYELASMKSAGISLFRIMLPLTLFAMGVAMFSYVCSEYIIPKSNLKYISRLHDLKRQKPTLGLDESIFNNDFYGYSIRIGQKEDNGKDIKDILIYDHSKSDASREVSIISASQGRMYVTPEQRYMVMELEEGYVYQNPENASGRDAFKPFVVIAFDKLTKVFDLGEFELDRTNEELFKSDRKMKNSKQLRTEIDSFSKLVKGDSEGYILSHMKPTENKTAKAERHQGNRDDLYFQKKQEELDSLYCAWLNRNDSFYIRLKSSVLQTIEIEQNRLNSAKTEKKHYLKQKARIEYELLLKQAMAFVCFMFIFIGAPLGAIVRKGGYGYPLILCILVFVAYLLMNTFCKRLTEGLRIDTFSGAWLPIFILGLPSILLTWTAMRDRNVLQDLKLLFQKFWRK